jgi:hypothetical protein
MITREAVQPGVGNSQSLTAFSLLLMAMVRQSGEKAGLPSTLLPSGSSGSSRGRLYAALPVATSQT